MKEGNELHSSGKVCSFNVIIFMGKEDILSSAKQPNAEGFVFLILSVYPSVFLSPSVCPFIRKTSSKS